MKPNLAFDPIFWYDATAPALPPYALHRAPKGKKLIRQQARQRFWLTIWAALLLAVVGSLTSCAVYKPRKNSPSWTQREALNEVAR